MYTINGHFYWKNAESGKTYNVDELMMCRMAHTKKQQRMLKKHLLKKHGEVSISCPEEKPSER